MVSRPTKRRLMLTIILVVASVVVVLVSLFWTAALPALGVIALALISLAGSNLLYDRGVPNSMSRRFAPVVGGFAYLIAIIWLEKWTAIAICGILALLILFLRFKFQRGLRGVRGNHPAQNWAEITYTVAGTLSMVIGWGLLNDKWLAFLPVAFMAWGDTAAGIARELIGLDVKNSSWHMGAMLVVCLVAVAIWYRPFWVGAVGAVAATLAERFRPGVLRFWDDNLNLVAASLVIMAVLARIAS
jgi:dolichol kinase